mmetsp:Transcript_11430/g.28868  ORF Transcript_11430/g.28868 Transcript_11430/m.28868 type:complete len:205 (-) Transcript_11430:865-1479(-)
MIWYMGDSTPLVVASCCNVGGKGAAQASLCAWARRKRSADCTHASSPVSWNRLMTSWWMLLVSACSTRGWPHVMSGVMPIWSISWSLGVVYLATVTKRADPSSSSYTLWILPFPKVGVLPMICARLLSCSAPARISDAEALPLLTSTARGRCVRALPSGSATSCAISSMRPCTWKMGAGPSSHRRAMSSPAWTRPPPLLRRSRM